MPLLIFSAGVGDILKEVLRQQNLLLPNMKIIANFMQFDEKVCIVFLIQGIPNKKLGNFKGNLSYGKSQGNFIGKLSRNLPQNLGERWKKQTVTTA